MVFIKRALEQPRPSDEAKAGRRREHLRQALAALGHAVEGHPRLAQLLASRPALAPLVAALELSCTSAASPPPSYPTRTAPCIPGRVKPLTPT